ncbi:MAG: extracellular solute-binding protein [Lachnospiraceae bacterium]|nr:extracellular solute-binding protein [Lachnospiraceae bacterium]
MRIRRIPLVGMAALMAVSVCGCHGSTADLTQVEIEEGYEFDESRNYEITFWAKNDTNKAQTNIYKKAIEDFEALYPNITVTMKLYTDYGKIYNDVITNISTGTTPNVCITYPDHIATYMTGQNIVVNLDELMVDKNYGLGGEKLKFDSPTKEEVVSQFLEECKIGGSYYALPYMRSTEACYVNKTYVEKLGYTLPETLTWDFVWEVSESAMRKNASGNFKVNGQSVMIPFIYKSTDNMMITMLKQLNAGYSKSNGEVLIFNDTTKDLLYTISEHAATRAFSTFKISSYPANFLNAGQCIFAIDSTAGATWMGSDAPLLDISEDQIVDFETVVMTIPQFDTDNPQMISQGPSICVFNKSDQEEVMASWLFAQFLLTNDVQIAYSQTEGYVPVTEKAQQSEEYQAYLAARGEDNDKHYYVKIDAAKLLLENTDNTFVTPVFNGSTSLRDAAGQLVENVTKDTRRKKTVDEAYMKQLFSDVSTLYKLDQIVVSEEVSEPEEGDEEKTETEKVTAKKDLGELPSGSKALLTGLVIVWSLIIVYAIYEFLKKKKNNPS